MLLLLHHCYTTATGPPRRVTDVPSPNTFIFPAVAAAVDVLVALCYFGVSILGFYAFGTSVNENVLLSFHDTGSHSGGHTSAASAAAHGVVVAASMMVVVHVAAAFQVSLAVTAHMYTVQCPPLTPQDTRCHGQAHVMVGGKQARKHEGEGTDC
jgi:hypothetical protein